MTDVVEHLAALTAFRDRDVLDVSLVGLLRDLLRPQRVAIYRPVGEGDERRWLTRANLAAGDVAAAADPLWVDLATLPPLADFPERQTCLLTGREVIVAGETVHSHFPLVSDGDVVGVLEVESREPLTPEQRPLVGSILRVFRNFQDLLDYSERDTLTGLLNRKTFDDAVMRHAVAPPPEVPAAAPAAAGARRQGADVRAWLGIIDIDHFKRINDDHGHLIGDEVLLLLARLMRSSFRANDRLYRFGGEEFAVLMRCAGPEAAAGVLERLRRHVEQFSFPRVGHITVSVGFTELSDADTPTSAFERADKAIYFAKEHGRNQVVSHASLVAAGTIVDATRISGTDFF